MAIVGLTTPWVRFYRELDAMFKYDQEVNVVYDATDVDIKIYVNNAKKADALSQLIPVTKEFGNVTVNITVIPANGLGDIKSENLFADAFENNPALSYIRTFEGMFSFNATYVVFKNEVVQYFTDDLSDINGLESTLFEDIADDVFDTPEGVFFCTDIPATIVSAYRVSNGKPVNEK